MTTALLTMSKNQGEALGHGLEADGRRPLVLVVEDHEDTSFLLTYLLHQRGCRVIEARDGEDGVRQALETRPDLVLMDISLPRMDGLAAARQLRQAPALRDVPIVFLSGHAEASYRAEALARGGSGFLVKPFAPAEIERLVETYLGHRHAVRRGEAALGTGGPGEQGSTKEI